MFAKRTPLAFGLALFAVNQVLVTAGEHEITLNVRDVLNVYIPLFDEAKHGAIVFQMDDKKHTNMTVYRATSNGYLESKVDYDIEPSKVPPYPTDEANGFSPERNYESFRPGPLHFIVRMDLNRKAQSLQSPRLKVRYTEKSAPDEAVESISAGVDRNVASKYLDVARKVNSTLRPQLTSIASELESLDKFWAIANNVSLSDSTRAIAKLLALTMEKGLPAKMDVWLPGHGEWMSSTMEVERNSRQLTILPKLMSAMPVNFRKYMDVVKDVTSALQAQRTLPAPDYSALEMLWAIANDMAVSDEEKRLVRWQAIAIASIPRAADNSGPSLVTDLDEYLSGSIDAVRVAAKQQDTAMKKFMFNRAQTTIAELNEKLNATLHSLNLDVLPAIRRELESLIAKEREVSALAEAAKDNAGEYAQELKRIEASKRCARFFDILGQVLESIGKVISTGFESHGAGVEFAGGSFSLAGGEWGNDLDSKIAELKEEIARQMKLGEDYGIIQELLASSEGLVVSMIEAGAKGSLGLRTWLASPAVLNFRSKLVLMTPENFEAAQSGNYIASILADVCQNIIGTMDKAEYYIGQKNIINQLTPPLPSTGDSEEFGPMVTLARTMVYENMVLANHRTVRQGMQLFAFPFCSVVRESLAENCESGRTLEELVRCSTDDLTRLRGAIRQDSSASSRGDDGLSCSTFDVAHGRDSSYTTWTSAEYGAQIRDLLAGKRVLFNADVATSLEDTFAVKFNALSIKFWNGSYTKHQGLHTALEQGFRLQLTHMGNSYFKCGSDVVTFPHRLVTLLASFSVHSNGEPEFASEDYLKFLRGDAFLSPYATWAVQLIPVSTRGVAPANFSSLQAFANDDVNMSLVGYGTFVETARHCQECEGTDFKTLKSGTVTSKVKPRPRPNRPNKLTKLKPQQGLQASSRNCPWRPLS